MNYLVIVGCVRHILTPYQAKSLTEWVIERLCESAGELTTTGDITQDIESLFHDARKRLPETFALSIVYLNAVERIVKTRIVNMAAGNTTKSPPLTTSERADLEAVAFGLAEMLATRSDMG